MPLSNRHFMILASCARDQASFANTDGKQSFFTKRLIAGLRGDGIALKQGIVDTDRLADFLSLSDTSHEDQHPQVFRIPKPFTLSVPASSPGRPIRRRYSVARDTPSRSQAALTPNSDDISPAVFIRASRLSCRWARVANRCPASPQLFGFRSSTQLCEAWPAALHSHAEAERSRSVPDLWAWFWARVSLAREV